MAPVAVKPLDESKEFPAEVLRLANLRPRGLRQIARKLHIEPEKLHQHVWTMKSLHAAIEAMRSVVPPELGFSVHEAYLAERSAFIHREYRVVLQRNPRPAGARRGAKLRDADGKEGSGWLFAGLPDAGLFAG